MLQNGVSRLCVDLHTTYRAKSENSIKVYAATRKAIPKFCLLLVAGETKGVSIYYFSIGKIIKMESNIT